MPSAPSGLQRLDGQKTAALAGYGFGSVGTLVYEMFLKGIYFQFVNAAVVRDRKRDK
jgi:hypothetical protein